jgi:hypothetical protein
MAKSYKARVRPIKASPEKPAQRGQLHKVALINRGTYFDAKCETCGRGAICGGLDADKLLKDWAAWHASNVEVHESGERNDATTP